MNDMQAEAFASANLARQYGYEVLSALFAEEPGNQVLEAVSGDLGRRCFSLLLEEEGLNAFCGLCGCIDELREDGGYQLEGVASEYTRLFIGPGRKQAHPYESVYATEDRSLFQECTLQVRACYRKHGWASAALHREPDDHIALELAFMARLCSLQNAVLETGARDAGDWDEILALLEEQRSFAEEHLLVVAKGVSDSISELARMPFYAYVGTLVREFATCDLRTVGELIDALPSAE